MKKKSLFLSLLAIALTTSALALTGSSIAQKSTSKKKATVSSPFGLKEVPAGLNKEDREPASQTQTQQAPASPQDQEVPLHVVYDQMFRHIKELNKKADEEASQGKDGEHFRTLYKRLARLEDPQSQALDRIAREVDREIEPLNKKAIEIIRSIRERHKDGKLAQGELPPEPPAELRVLADERRQVIMRAREELRASIGDDAFQRFDKFVKKRIKPGIRRLNNPPATQGTTP
ncbi:MAG TPA: hypothetical protein VKB05_08965 [Pyrinomonadaceae bacterium]|nr:hypothetical protein [Pyrinomonadaceae bacterium]